jgi:hypothetical protein
MASEMTGKTVFSVEGDRSWYRKMLRYFETAGMISQVHMHLSNIGAVGKWGHPKTHDKWRQFHRYPAAVWDLDDFETPDVVLIDGRFRAACLVTTMLRTEKPVTVLFDDFCDRQRYKIVERWVQPVEVRARMAKFNIEPTDLPRQDLTDILSLYSKSF